MRPGLRRLFDSSAPELSSQYRVGGWNPRGNVDFLKTKHIGESMISRRFQIWSQIWQGGTIKNIYFFVFNLGINQVQTEKYILGSASQPIVKHRAISNNPPFQQDTNPRPYTHWIALWQICRMGISEHVACDAFSRFSHYACR